MNYKATQQQSLPSISAFPAGSDLWRIDWFGQIAFPDRLRRRNHPSVEVYLSKVKSSTFLSNVETQLSTESTWPVEGQIVRYVSVGVLTMLRIGDIWSDKKYVGSPAYSCETFKDVLIARNSEFFITAGSKLPSGAHILPFSEHPWHARNTHSWCARVPLSDGTNVVVPCMELIRFYFGSSSPLLESIFNTEGAKGSIYRKWYRFEETQDLFVELGSRIPRNSAADVGRIAGSNAAKYAVATVRKSLLEASTARKETFPKARFPIEGITTLVAHGKWLPDGGLARRTFLVYRLQSCSHPFPFNALRYQIDRSSQRTSRDCLDKSKNVEAAKSPAPEFSSRVKASDEAKLVDEDASTDLAPLQVTVWSQRSFPDLDNKQVLGRKSINASSKGVDSECEESAKRTIPSSEIDEMSVGESGSARRIRPILLAEATRRSHRIPKFLRLTVEALSKLPNSSVSLVTSSSEDGWTIPIPIVTIAEGEIPRRLFFRDETGEHLRRVSVFEVNRLEEILYIKVLEDSPTVVLAGDPEFGQYLTRDVEGGVQLDETMAWVYRERIDLFKWFQMRADRSVREFHDWLQSCMLTNSDK